MKTFKQTPKQTFSITLIAIAACLTLGCAGTKDTTTQPPAAGDSMSATEGEAAADPVEQNIVEVAVAAGSFNTLAQALTAADLVETLQGEGPFTVFAPTDEAFAALPEGALDNLLADPAALKQVLLLHVVSGKVMAADVAGITEATAMSGGTLPIDTSAGVKIGAATVTQADVLASNGVIHVIDTVLLPQ